MKILRTTIAVLEANVKNRNGWRSKYHGDGTAAAAAAMSAEQEKEIE